MIEPWMNKKEWGEEELTLQVLQCQETKEATKEDEEEEEDGEEMGLTVGELVRAYRGRPVGAQT